MIRNDLENNLKRRANSQSISLIKFTLPFPKQALVFTGLLKTLWEKEKLLETSNFSISHSVFYPFWELPAIFNKVEIVYPFWELYAIFNEFEILVCELFRIWCRLRTL